MSSSTPEDHDRVVVRDKRKIDPVTGEARKGGTAAEGQHVSERSATPAVEVGQGPFVDAELLDERTRDLQRVQAEYANYRKRAERDRLAAGEIAVGRVLAELLPILDNIDRAREHGDLTGGLKAVADQLGSVVDKLGLVAFGEVGDPFDPSIHEAVMHAESDEVAQPTATTIMRQGYLHGDRLLRPAMVGVTDPATPAPPATAPAEDETQVSTSGPDGENETEPAAGSATDAPQAD